MKALEITVDNFKSEVLESSIPVLLDFWAEWCGPCKALTPVVEELAVEFEGRVKIGKVDVDKNNPIAEQFGVRAIPTLIIFKDGKEFDKLIGALPKGRIVQKLQAAI